MTQIRPLVAGNWKMNGLKGAASEVLAIRDRLSTAEFNPEADVLICPPVTLIATLSDLIADTSISLGGQDCHGEISGAHTGDISAEMLADAGASAVIVGHSERRTDHGERDKDIYLKTLAVHRAGLIAIICIGETEAERRAGQTLDVVKRQLHGSLPTSALVINTVIAYEPIWAIGTGLTPTVDDIAEVHGMIRQELAAIVDSASAEQMRLLYGGSVKLSNAAELMAIENVNGALVGGASLQAESFLGIIAAYISDQT